MKPFDPPEREAFSANDKTRPEHAANGAANDLRSYLQRSAALRSRAFAATSRGSGAHPVMLANGTLRPPFKSLNALLDHLRTGLSGEAPPVVLIMPGRPEIDATRDAIRIARAQAAKCSLGVLVDLARNVTALSDQLGIPRAPGFAEVASRRAGFEAVVRVDTDTPLQIIPAGERSVTLKTKPDPQRLARILGALVQVYDTVVLHADHATGLLYQPHLAGRLGAVIAVRAPGEGKTADRSSAELAAFGCPVLSFEQSIERRWFARRSA